MTDDIRQRILEASPKKKNKAAETVELPKKDLGSTSTMILGACIMILSVLAVLAIFNKNSAFSKVDLKKEPPKTSAYATKLELEASIAKINERIDKSSARMDLWSHRVWLLAMANNENVSLRKKQEAQYPGIVENKYIFFDENWRVNRFPDSMELTDKQKQDLQKDLKKPD